MTPAVVHGLPLKAYERLGPADLAVAEAGDPAAPTVVLLHGFPTHGVLWRRVTRRLGDLHTLVPDLLGLGDTVVSPYEDFSAPMQADLLLDWLDRRGIEQAVLVGHEQGGAVAQQVVANHPERVAGLVLVATVAYDNWPVPLAAQVMRLARTPGVDVLAYALDLPRRVAANGLIGYGRAVYDSRTLDPDIVEEYLRPLLTTEGRERARRFLLAGDDRVTLECVPGLRAYEGPAAVVWGADDPFLSPSWGTRLVEDLAGVDALTLVPFCGHLVPEEAPDAVAAAVRDVVARAGEPASGAGSNAG
ncbi:MAG TPA: alpha/beta hydrolase [Iamia sp.]|nr:alpha/beta hydrolase [Iamia sp.]